ncbi:hypothetical protein Ssi03_66160 [Sphaerisporangium siamense]|uniref:Parallel beta-helix repeat protein n=1 Tax=Sphaerisporangium siamense TaxID=795645 RepID=A0A7W7DFQ6_9ACTN|nr:right-handed parallel beta-helix repeat-containing protein [Sphaerisporangium siamense]MBB4706019.1 parallel beta-helix repeat protein [Sphaerisporangium siamense]GII88626.1 hypothetical protein Ssi03_66160 [Sphaerisporangium siamense]
MRTNRSARADHGPRFSRTFGRRGWAGFAAVLPAALTLSGQAAAAADPAPTPAAGCGVTLTTSVTLTEDLVCADRALLIGANDITIDLNGHTIRGPGTGTGISADYFRDVSWTNITVKNGKIEGFPTAIYYANVTGGAVTNVQAGGQIRLEAVKDLTISGSYRRCVLGSFHSWHGRVTIDHCTLHGVTRNLESATTVKNSRLISGQLRFNQSDNSTIVDNVLDDYPVSMGTESRGNVFRNNVFKNADIAFETGGAIRPNTIEGNTFKDNSIGITGYLFSENITGNRFIGNRTAGIYLGDYAQGPNTITGNTFTRNGHDPSGLTDRQGNPVRGGIHISPRQPPASLTITGNTGRHNAGYFIYAPPGTATDGGGNKGRPCGPEPSAVTCR